MVVIGLEKDEFGPSSGGTQTFINGTGIQIAADDTDHVAHSQFFPESRRNGTQNASDFIVVNGVAGSPSHALWEILFKQSRTPRTSDLRDAINSVLAPPPEPPRLTPIRFGSDEGFVFRLQGTPGQGYAIETSENAEDWSVWMSIELEEDAAEIVDSTTNGASQNFYRVREE